MNNSKFKKKYLGNYVSFTCPLVETADMDTVVMTVTTLDKVMSRRPWTRPEKKRFTKLDCALVDCLE